MPKNKIKKEKIVLVNPKQVIGINFLAFELYDDIDIAHTTHMMHCCETKKVSSRKILIHMLDLTKGIDTIEDEELKQWFNFFYSENFEQEKEMIAQQSPIMKKAVNAYDTFVSSDDCMSYAEKHQLYKMYQEWEAQAREEKGIKEGAHNKAIENAKNAIAMGLDSETIAKITGLSEEEIRKLIN